jgi:hypothetical protein
LLDYLLNLHDMVRAASYLGDVRNLAVTAERLRCEEIMIIMGRRLYEAVQAVGEHLLTPLLSLVER